MAKRYTDKELAEAWVLLNCWVWPTNVLGRPPHSGDLHTVIRGAHQVIDLWAMERGLLGDGGPIDTLWTDDDKRAALLSASSGPRWAEPTVSAGRPRVGSAAGTSPPPAAP